MSIANKTLRCEKCGQEIVVKSFRISDCRKTADGLLCKDCANGIGVGKTADIGIKTMKNNGEINNSNENIKIGDNLSFAAKEAYNLLRTNISFAFPDAEGGKVLGISSAGPQEGKSTTAINLAYSLSEDGHKVLLIDADMRRPSIYLKIESLEMAPGLSNVLSGNETAAIHEAVIHENFDVLTSGDIPPNPSELIGSRKMKEFLDECRKNYDYIVIDLPPVLSVADTLAISKYIDGVALVVKNDSAKCKDVTETVRQLQFANAKIVGFVYNKMDAKSGKQSRNANKYYR